MTVVSDYAIAIATLGNRLKNLAPLFSTDDKQTHSHLARDFSHALSKLQDSVTARKSDWFISLFGPVVIGRTVI